MMQSDQTYTPKKQKRIGILIFLLLITAGVFLIIMPGLLKAAIFNLPITLHSNDEADYSSDTVKEIPKVDLNIIKDIIRDDASIPGDYDKRLAAHVDNLDKAIPTATSAPAIAMGTPVSDASTGETLSQERLATETAVNELSITASLSPTGTLSPTATLTPTNTATNTPTRTPTNTPLPPTATNTPTSTPINTPLPLTATNTPTSTPTNTALPPTATNTPTSTPSQTTVPCAGSGSILHELWYTIPGENVSDLTSDPRYPDEPTGWSFLNLFEVPTNVGNEFGQRVHGYVCAPYTGQYRFYIASDDNSELWLSPDSNPDGAIMIANVPGWTMPRVWDKYPENQQSTTINLISGQWYYISALAKERDGGDNLAVGWVGPDELEMTTPVIIDGQYLQPAATAHSVPTRTPTRTPTSTAVTGCSDPLPVDGELPDGFVVDSTPAPNAANVSTSISTITIFYNQPMQDQSTGGGVRSMGIYTLQTSVGNNVVEILSITYDQVLFSATITFNNSDANWLPATGYELRIKKGLENSCGTDQDDDVNIYFTTAP